MFDLTAPTNLGLEYQVASFEGTLNAVAAGLKDGSIPAIKEVIYCLNSAHITRPVRSTKRWAKFVEPNSPNRVTYVAEDGEMAEPMPAPNTHHHHGDLTWVRSFLPVTSGAIGEMHVLGLESLLKAA